MTIRLLMTARDVAAALHLVQIAKRCQSDPRFELIIAAQQPAARHFVEAGLAVREVPPMMARTSDGEQADMLRATARQLLLDVAPDAVLVGLSTPFDAGLDEAVLAVADVPTILFQDFWGEQNLILGRAANLLLAVDLEAAKLNQARFGISSQIVGSARHAAYVQMDIGGIRQRVRSRLQVQSDDMVIGFFGQALHHLPGYARTLECFIDALQSVQKPFKLIVRPHPREDETQRRKTEAMFLASGIAASFDVEGSVESSLVACDVVCSLFSTCTYDAAYLNRFSSEPIAVPISMLFDSEIEAYCRQHVNFSSFPYHVNEVVLPVFQINALTETIEQSMQPQRRADIWSNAQRHLPDPARAPQNVLNEIYNFVCATAGERN